MPGLYGGQIQTGPPFTNDIGVSLPVEYAFGLDILVTVVFCRLPASELSRVSRSALNGGVQYDVMYASAIPRPMQVVTAAAGR